MARMAHIVLPGVANPVTHRGNHRRAVFFDDRDRQLYVADPAVWAHDAQFSIWGYCLAETFERLRLATGTGRPCGDEASRAPAAENPSAPRRIKTSLSCF